jgi:hypothetical protein
VVGRAGAGTTEGRPAKPRHALTGLEACRLAVLCLKSSHRCLSLRASLGVCSSQGAVQGAEAGLHAGEGGLDSSPLLRHRIAHRRCT